MGSADLSEEYPLIACEAVEPDAGIISHHYELTVIVSKHELLELGLHLYLVGEDEGLRIVNVHTVAIVTHHSETSGVVRLVLV